MKYGYAAWCFFPVLSFLVCHVGMSLTTKPRVVSFMDSYLTRFSGFLPGINELLLVENLSDFSLSYSLPFGFLFFSTCHLHLSSPSHALYWGTEYIAKELERWDAHSHIISHLTTSLHGALKRAVTVPSKPFSSIDLVMPFGTVFSSYPGSVFILIIFLALHLLESLSNCLWVSASANVSFL